MPSQAWRFARAQEYVLRTPCPSAGRNRVAKTEITIAVSSGTEVILEAAFVFVEDSKDEESEG